MHFLVHQPKCYWREDIYMVNGVKRYVYLCSVDKFLGSHGAPWFYSGPGGDQFEDQFPAAFPSVLMYKGKALLYLYRPNRLSRDLSRREAGRLLDRAGYRREDPRACLRELSRRLRRGEEFPHEIGLFLGYPPEDVAGFMEHRGKGFKCAGCWKVYGDEGAARRRFQVYKSCTGNYCTRWARGASLEALTVPGK